MIWFVFLILATLFAAPRLLRLLRNYLKWRTLQAIPGPHCSFWVGQFWAIKDEPFMAPHKKWWRDIVGYDAPLLRYNSLFGNNMLIIFDTAIIKEILTAPVGKDDCRFYRNVFFLPNIIGKGLVTLEGEEWLKHRRIIQPSFAVSSLKQALDASVPPKVKLFVDLWLQAGEGREIDLVTHLSALTLDVIGDVGFSHDCNGLKDVEMWSKSCSSEIIMDAPDDDDATTKTKAQEEAAAIETPELSDPLLTSLTALLKPDIVRLVFFLTGLISIEGHINPKTRRVRAALNDTVDGIIENARKLDTNNNSRKAKSLIQLLLDAKDTESSSSNNAGLSDIELRDELKTFLLAGHETTSTWCYWAMFALAKYPDVQEKLYQEINKVVGSATTTSSSKISLEQAEQMEYLDAFLQECLRLFPPVGMMVRFNRKEETFAGHKIPQDVNLVIPIHLLHRHPKHWGPDPDTFRPERWLSTNGGGETAAAAAAAGGLDTKGFTFLPFGAGGHNCIGYRFATLEAKLIMVHLIHSLRVEIAPSQRNVEHTFTTIVTMKAKPALKVVVKSRGQKLTE